MSLSALADRDRYRFTDVKSIEGSIQLTENTGVLRGQVALVTGASSGIGEATALALATHGAKVAVSARREDRLKDLVRRIEEAGGEALPIVADVADEEQANRMVQTTLDTFKRLDILVNNAGVMLLGKIDGANTEDWHRMINTNVLGLMYTTHAALPAMKAQDSGHIVNISSVAGRIARLGNGVYSASKWAVGAFSESLRLEVHSNNIRVTIVEPGIVATELANHITDQTAKKQFDEWINSLTPLESVDIAETIIYAVTQPKHVNVNEILIRPTGQS
jgi:NADP-dependent 3-hydroxy acid dehydrogenase YdfG